MKIAHILFLSLGIVIIFNTGARAKRMTVFELIRNIKVLTPAVVRKLEKYLLLLRIKQCPVYCNKRTAQGKFYRNCKYYQNRADSCMYCRYRYNCGRQPKFF